MKRLLTRRAATVLALLLLAVSSTYSASAQTQDETPEIEQSGQESNWRTLLNLTPEQVRQIRAIRRANRLEWQAARQRVRNALGALDQAIYSDDASEAVIEQRAREVAEAQAAQVHLRAMTELSIRRVLTPAQLDTFRAIRGRRARAAEERRRLGAGANALGDTGRRPLLNPRRRRNALRERIRP
ncbi:MAG TPA: Spy/CpxP family protein refolding chaperone [Pyrinomonadaceae bacterium]|nr:Spy/CpxP family protein refolding chaperone [Pyrinomonadaceae bacterium]